MPKAVQKLAAKTPKKGAKKSVAKKPAVQKKVTKKPALKLAPKPAPKAAPKPLAKVSPTKAAPVAQKVTKVAEPVGMWKLLAQKKAHAEARRDQHAERLHSQDDDRNRFAKHDTRFAKFAGPRRRAS